MSLPLVLFVRVRCPMAGWPQGVLGGMPVGDLPSLDQLGATSPTAETPSADAPSTSADASTDAQSTQLPADAAATASSPPSEPTTTPAAPEPVVADGKPEAGRAPA